MISVGRNSSKPYMAAFGLPRGIHPGTSSPHEWIELISKEKVVETINAEIDIATPLQRAIVGGDEVKVKMLLNKTTVHYPASDGSTPLHTAVKVQSLKFVEMILQVAVDDCVLVKNNWGVTPLHLASGLSDRSILKALLKHAAYKDVLDDEKLSPLHFAVLYNQVENVKILIYNNANPAKRTVDGFTPLHVAACLGLEDIVLSILSAPEGPRSTGMADTEGWLPLHCAVYYQHLGIVRYLVQVGYADASNNDGYTPLHLAAYSGYIDAVNILLPFYSNINLRTFEGLTPKQVAVKYHNYQLALELDHRTTNCTIS